MLRNVFFWAGIVLLGFLGLRNLVTLLFFAVKPHTRPCYATMFFIYCGSAAVAAALRLWWLLPVGLLAGFLFRRLVIWSGEQAKGAGSGDSGPAET